MPINTKYVGQVGKPLTEVIDPRWAMNFAASIGDLNPALYATDKGKLPVHPIYLDYSEWEATRSVMENLNLAPEERARGVATGIAQIMHRPLETGMEVTTTAKIVGIHRHRAGAQVDKLIEIRSGSELICTSIFNSIFRDVQVEGDDVFPDSSLIINAEKRDQGEMAVQETITLPAHFCHIYSECARAFNPIHTDIAAAKSAGLPGLILHGSATMALAVSEIVNRFGDGDMDRLSSLSGNYRAMVLVPGSVRVDIEEPVTGDECTEIFFTVMTEEGRPAIANGRVQLKNSA